MKQEGIPSISAEYLIEEREELAKKLSNTTNIVEKINLNCEIKKLDKQIANKIKKTF